MSFNSLYEIRGVSEMEEKPVMAIVCFRDFDRVYLAEILPLSQLPYVPEPQYQFSKPNSEISNICKPQWLTARGLDDVIACLSAQGLNADNYYTRATVHDRSKKKMHQGIIYIKRMIDITEYASPKPTPSAGERAMLYFYVLAKIKSGVRDWESLINLAGHFWGDEALRSAIINL